MDTTKDTERSNDIVQVNPRVALEPRDRNEAWQLAKVAVESGFFAVKNAAEALIIIMTGRELGLTTTQSLRGIYVVKGRPMVSADAMVACVVADPRCEFWQPVESTTERCVIRTKRRGAPEPVTGVFTMEDAKNAGLLGSDMYKKYPRVMLRHRCAAELVREVYPDVVLGIYCEGEVPGEDPRGFVSLPREESRRASPEGALDAPPEAPVVASVQGEAVANDVAARESAPSSAVAAPPPPPLPAADPPALLAFNERVGEIELPGEGVAVWMKHRDEIMALGPEVSTPAWKALVARVESVGKMKGAGTWLKKACAEEDARRASTGAPCAGPTDGGPSSDWTATPEGMTRRAAELGDDGAVLADARLHFDLVGYAQALTARLVAFGHQHDDAAALIARTQREARERAKRTPPDDGSGGGARHSAKRSTRAEGHGADAPSPSSAPSNALTLVRDEVAEPGEPLTLARWRSHLDAPDAKGRPATKGLVAGRWWKHRGELDAAGLHDDAWAAVIAALYVLRVQNPEAWIESCRPGRQRSAPTPRTTKTTAPATQAA